jgi:propanol-preferring alcohol dehydrogenase
VWTEPSTTTGPGQLLLRLNCTGLCASDVHYMLGDLGARMSDFGVKSPGHEVRADPPSPPPFRSIC